MNETKQMLDRVLANILGLLADLPGMLRSSRTWAFLITVAVVYITLTKSGLQGMEALLAALAQVITGGTFIIGKSLRGGSPNSVVKPTMPIQAPVVNEKAPEIENVTPTIPEPVKPQKAIIYPLATVDWDEFWVQVDAEQRRLINELPREKNAEFARYEAILNVGKRFPVASGDDVLTYGNIVYDAALWWFQDITGFNYWEAQTNGVPDKFMKCGCKNLDAWVSTNPEVMKPIVAAIRHAVDRLNAIIQIEEGWQASFNDWQRTLNYVYENV